jgi:hypothetical protein
MAGDSELPLGTHLWAGLWTKRHCSTPVPAQQKLVAPGNWRSVPPGFGLLEDRTPLFFSEGACF